MFLLEWYREYREIRKEFNACETCETLKRTNDALRMDNEILLRRIIIEKSEEKERKPEEPVPITIPKNIPWAVRKQMLEKEDREKARLMREAPKPIDTKDLEKEMGIVEKDRESSGGGGA